MSFNVRGSLEAFSLATADELDDILRASLLLGLTDGSLQIATRGACASAFGTSSNRSVENIDVIAVGTLPLWPYPTLHPTPLPTLVPSPVPSFSLIPTLLPTPLPSALPTFLVRAKIRFGRRVLISGYEAVEDFNPTERQIFQDAMEALLPQDWMEILGLNITNVKYLFLVASTRH